MIDYLKLYNLKTNDLAYIKKKFNKDIIGKFEIMENNVVSVLDYLQSIGVKDFKELILNRPDICFVDKDYLKTKLEKIDINLIIFVIENDPQNLINFDI